MRRLLWFALLLLILAAICLPGLYFLYARDLPDLDSAEAIRAAVARSVEAERRAVSVVGARYAKVDFELLNPETTPRSLITGVLAVDGCPEFLTARMEQGYPRLRRIVIRWALNRHSGRGAPAACQLMYSEAIAASIGVGDRMHFAIADAHILGALQPYDLLGYRMSVMYFATGVIGARDGARRLFNKSLEELSLSQVAELLSAEADFPDWAVCKNPSKLRLWRDSIIDRMEAFRSIDADEAKAARARPVTCSLKP